MNIRVSDYLHETRFQLRYDFFINPASSDNVFFIYPASTAEGPSIKYVTLFLANFYPPPCHTLSHILGTPEGTSHISDPPFLVGLVQITRTKALVQILSQLFARVFVRGFCQGVFCLGWSLSIPPSVRIRLLQQKVKHHLKFHVSYYD